MPRPSSPRSPPRPCSVDDWVAAVTRVVKAIPRGEVLSYSQVALRAGMPGNPRGVVRALKLAKNLPWWRVVKAGRTLAPQVAAEQARRLRAEGATVRGRKVLAADAPARSPVRKARRAAR